MLSFQLIDRSLLQSTIDRESHVLIASELNRLTLNNLECFGKRATLNAKQRALQSRIAAIGSEEMRQRFVHRIHALDVAARVPFVISERLVHTATAIEYPTAQRRFRETPNAQILVAHVLERLILFRGVMGPVDVKRKQSDRQQHKQPAQRTQTAIGRRRSESFSDFLRQIFRNRRYRLTAITNQTQQQEQNDERKPANINQREQRRRSFRDMRSREGRR